MAKGRRGKNTKSKNPKVSDTVDSLRQCLSQVGLVVNDIEADGNCLFRAFASQYLDDEGMSFMNLLFDKSIDKHYEFRQACCEYMIDEGHEFFRSFLDDESLEDYVTHMREDGVWGTQMEIVSLCRKYAVNCVIFRPDGLHYRIECDSETDTARILMLSHHDDEHFNEVRFKEKGRVLQSFNELELLLTELQSGEPQRQPKPTKREARMKRRNPAPQIDFSDNNNPVSVQKLLDL